MNALRRMLIPALALAATPAFSASHMRLGTLVNPDVRIVAEDGRFTLVGGQTFTPPFQTSEIRWNGYACNLEGVDNVARDYATGLAGCDGRRVQLYVTGTASPLYGVLVLFHSYPDCSGPGNDSYWLEIPPNTLAGARQGKTVVAYEARDCADGQRYSWLLWLQNTPFPKVYGHW